VTFIFNVNKPQFANFKGTQASILMQSLTNLVILCIIHDGQQF